MSLKNSDNKRKSTTYIISHGFSCRTNRDKYQSVGELYRGSIDDLYELI